MMDLFIDNLAMAMNPAKGDVTLRRNAATEILHFLEAAWEREPGIFDRLGNHPAQPNWWIANLREALDTEPMQPSSTPVAGE